MSDKRQPQRPAKPLLEPVVRDYGDGRISRWGLDEGDLGQIDMMLAMTPAQRLRAVATFVQSVKKLSRA